MQSVNGAQNLGITTASAVFATYIVPLVSISASL